VYKHYIYISSNLQKKNSETV